MYNREEKLAFLDEKNAFKTERVALNAVGKAEKRNGKDVSLFSVEEMQDMFDTNFNADKSYREYAYLIIKDYILWRKSQGYEVLDSIDSVNIDNIGIIRRTMVSSPKHLDMVLDSFLEPVSKKSFDCLMRCYLWMPFLGMKNDTEVPTIKTNEVDLIKMIIAHNGKYYEMYKESIPAFRVVCEEDSLWFTRSDTGGNVRKRVKSEYLFRSFKRESLSLRTLRTISRSRCSKKGLTYSNIYWSGIFYRMFEFERIGIEPDFRSEAISQLKLAGVADPTEKTKQSRELMLRIETRYNNWKRAFS